MTEFSVNPHRRHAYGNRRFRVRWDGRVVPGVTRVSGLVRRTDTIATRDGNDPGTPLPTPGETTYEPITLERGRTHDDAFEAWADLVFDRDAESGETDLDEFQKSVVVDLLNEGGQVVMAFHVFDCWPSEYVALGTLDANDPERATESLTLQHTGWVRDEAVTEPAEE